MAGTRLPVALFVLGGLGGPGLALAADPAAPEPPSFALSAPADGAADGAADGDLHGADAASDVSDGHLPGRADAAALSDDDGAAADGRRGRATVRAAVVGSVGLAAGGGPTAALTFGGPRVSVVAGDWTFTLSFYPSLVFSDDWATAKVRPLLGAGPEIAWRSIAVFAPLYVVGETYRPLVGLAWRFR